MSQGWLEKQVKNYLIFLPYSVGLFYRLYDFGGGGLGCNLQNYEQLLPRLLVPVLLRLFRGYLYR